uniref:Putative ovule protein n=1 Tax=Solanum chacoense TaxID=4108 RepID=A0A0V0HL51_SOLCH
MYFHRPEITESPQPPKKTKTRKKLNQEREKKKTRTFINHKVTVQYPPTVTTLPPETLNMYTANSCIYIKKVMKTSKCFHTAIICNHMRFLPTSKTRLMMVGDTASL